MTDITDPDFILKDFGTCVVLGEESLNDFITKLLLTSPATESQTADVLDCKFMITVCWRFFCKISLRVCVLSSDDALNY